MPKYILVATPQIAFGELIRISLEESGNYRVRLVQTSTELLSSASHTDFAVAILDSDLGEESFISLAQTLLEKLPKLRLVVIPPENDPNHPSLSGLKVDGYLNRPFYLPDLIQMIEGLLGPSKDKIVPDFNLDDTQKNDSSFKTLPWIQDVNRVTQQLARSLLKTSAHAVVVICSGNVWSYAGKLDQRALKEIVAAVNRYWAGEEQGDMARYVHLESDNGEYLIYASYLGDNYILVLVYDVTFPLSQIRSQTNRLASSFTNQEPASLIEMAALTPEQAEPLVLDPELIHSSDFPDEQEQLISLQNPILVGKDEDESDLSSEDDVNLQINLASLLADMPSPDPDILPPVLESQWLPEISSAEVAPDEPSQFKVCFPWEETGGHRLNARLASSDIPTKPCGISEKTDQVVILNDNLIYTCILIPCCPQHFLTGELADKLALWVPELCSSFGWRLEGLAVRPEYLQWMMRVTPPVSPNGLIRIIRQNTSERIFALSDIYRNDNPGRDFWAPGYLMARGSQPPASQLLRSYIDQIRRNQGITIT